MQLNITSSTYLSRLQEVLNALDTEAIDSVIRVIGQAWQAGRQIITCGNGGSSLTAQHYIADWNKSIFLSSQVAFRGRTLLDNIGLLMAYANDISFADIFAEQLKNILQPQDVVIAISGSGNSENVVRAVQYANDHDAVTIGICGYSGGKLKEFAQHVVWVNVNDMQLVEDVHAILGHVIMRALSAC